MIGDNSLPHHCQTAEDARAYATIIAALRAEIECIEEAHKPALDYLKAQADECRAERDGKTKPLAERMESLRKELAAWLAGDPDGNLKDGERIVATLSRKAGAPKIDAAKLPAEFFSPQPNMAAISLALAKGQTVPGVTVPISTVLRVL